jgi:C1A family cysteine protease
MIFLKKTLMFFLMCLNSTTAFAAIGPNCSELFSPVAPFTVSEPQFFGKVLGTMFSNYGYKATYQEVLKYADTQSDFNDLFASFKANKISQRQQKSILKLHPALRALKATDQILEDYVVRYNKTIDKKLIEDVHSPAFKELNSSKVIDQCSTGTCWINSATSALESSLSKSERIDISEQYIYAQSLIDQTFKSTIHGLRISEGGNLTKFYELIREHGYVLTKDWSPKIDIYKNPKELKQKLIHLAAAYRSNVIYAVKSGDKDLLASLEQNIKAHARTVIETELGPLPEPSLIKKIPDQLEVRFLTTRFTAKTLSDVLLEISRHIDQGQEAYISLNSNGNDFKQKKTLEQSTGYSPIGHAMAIVGYIKDGQGQVALLKIKNSWGKEIGDDGFIYLSRTFLRQTFASAGYFVEK